MRRVRSKKMMMMMMMMLGAIKLGNRSEYTVFCSWLFSLIKCETLHGSFIVPVMGQESFMIIAVWSQHYFAIFFLFRLLAH